MARFLGVAVQTDILVTVPIGTTPARVTFFRAEDLVSCVAVHSPTEAESLTVEVRRDDPRAADLVLGRVLRLTHEGGTGDTEWDITAMEDTSAADVLTVRATPILMRLARVVYMGTDATTGAPVPDWTGVLLTATEWLNLLVIPTLATAGIPFELGTVDNTTSRFTMDGDWTSVLEIVRAIAEPGRAASEVQLTAGGDYGYVLDLRTSIGASAATVRVRTAVNLLEFNRERSLVEVATRLYPRGSTDSVATRTMADHLFRIATIVSGTVAELDDPFGGADPILYDDQLNGFYAAPLVLGDPTFSSQVVTDSVAATQRITVASTAGWTAGEWIRFYAATGANGARVTSLTHPTLVDHPADGGYGDRALILDRPGIVADTNLIENATMRTWTVAADPPDGWEEFADDPTDVVFSQVTTDGPSDFTECFDVTLATGGGRVAVFGAFVGGTSADAVQGPAIAIRSPVAQPWNTTGRTYVATCWIKVLAAPTGGQVSLYLYDEDRAATEGYRPDQQGGVIGTWVEGTDTEGAWIRYESAALAMDGTAGEFPLITTALSGRVRVAVELGSAGDTSVAATAGAWQGRWDAGTAYAADDYVSYNGALYRCTTAPSTGDTPPGSDWTATAGAVRVADTGWQVRVGPVTLAEAPSAIADREGSGGTELWQAANAELPNVVTAVKGYDLTVADLAADDAATYATLAFTPGGMVEVIDTDLGVTTTLRLVEYTRDYLRPLASGLRVGNPPDRMTSLTDTLRPTGIFG